MNRNARMVVSKCRGIGGNRAYSPTRPSNLHWRRPQAHCALHTTPSVPSLPRSMTGVHGRSPAARVGRSVTTFSFARATRSAACSRSTRRQLTALPTGDPPGTWLGWRPDDVGRRNGRRLHMPGAPAPSSERLAQVRLVPRRNAECTAPAPSPDAHYARIITGRTPMFHAEPG